MIHLHQSHLEVLVVLLEHPDGESLYAELAGRVHVALPVRRAGHAQHVLRLQLPDLQQDDGQVVHEKERVHQGARVQH